MLGRGRRGGARCRNSWGPNDQCTASASPCTTATCDMTRVHTCRCNTAIMRALLSFAPSLFSQPHTGLREAVSYTAVLQLSEPEWEELAAEMRL